jgi:hypothetical protein
MQAALDLRGYSLRKSGVNSSMVTDGSFGAGAGATAVPWRTLGVNTDLLLVAYTVDGSNAYRDPRDTPVGTIGFQNAAATNKPTFRFGGVYIAGIGQPAVGLWSSDDTFVAGGVRTWNLKVSIESTGTLATILDGTRHSAYESFIQNGDFKPWMRIEGYRHGITFGPGGSIALVGNVSRTSNVVTVNTAPQQHRFIQGAAIWKTSDNNSADLALFGANSTGSSSFTVASVVDQYTFTYASTGANGTSQGVINYSGETDTTAGRDATSGTSVYAFLDGQNGSDLRANGGTIARALPRSLFLQQPLQLPQWFNGGGQTFSNQGIFIVGTGSANTTATLPHINTADVQDGLVVFVKNWEAGAAHTLSVSAQDGAFINGSSSAYVLAPATGAMFVSAGGNWMVFKFAAA